MMRALLIIVAVLLLCGCTASFDGREGIVEGGIGCPVNPCAPACPTPEKAP